MKKKIFNKILFVLILFITIISFVYVWELVKNGYDKQNKLVLALKEIIPTNISRKIRDTIFFIPNLIR